MTSVGVAARRAGAAGAAGVAGAAGDRTAAPDGAIRLGDALLVVAWAVTIGIVCSADYFPYHDATNNLARYVLMDRAWFGTPAPFVQVRLIPTPYIALDLVGVALVHLLGPTGGLRAMACLLVTIIPLGMYLLLRATCPARRGWAVVGVLASVSFYLLIGFFNFVAGIGAALLYLAFWWPRRDATGWRVRVGVAVGLALVFLVHLAGAMSVLVVLGIAFLEQAWARHGDRGARHPWRSAVTTPRLVTLIVATAAVGVMWLLWHLSLGPEPPLASVPPEFRTLPNKLANLASPFYGYSFAQMTVMGGAYAISLVTFLIVNRRTLRADPLLLSAIAFVVLFLVFPYRVDGAGFVDMRWLLPAMLLPFCATARAPVPAQQPWLVIPLAGALGHAALVRYEMTGIDRELRVYRRVLDVVPAGASLLPLVVDGQRYGRLAPYRHFALWHTIDRGGRVPGLLTEEERYDADPPRLSHKFFGHFREPATLYYPDERWGNDIVFPTDSLDWRRIDAEYDYVVVAGTDRRARTVVRAHADPVATAGRIALFRTRALGGARAAARRAAAAAAAAGIAGGALAGPGAAPAAASAPPARTARPAPPAARPTPSPGSPAARPPSLRQAGGFAHPGGLHSAAQLQYVAAKIRAGEQPWSSAYDQLLGSVGRVRTRQPHALAVYDVPGYYQDRAGFFAATGGVTGDADAAYVLALAYRLSGNQADADLAQRILTAWARTNTGVTGYDGQLSMTEVGVGFILSAELLSDYGGWSQPDRDAFSQWVRSVYLAQAANPIKDRKNNWGEWGTFGAVAADYYLDDRVALNDETRRLTLHIDSAIAPDGHMPEETARGSGGIWYTYFALAPMTAAAQIIKNAGGPDLFQPNSETGQRIKAALGYLFAALQQPQQWPFGANPMVPATSRDQWAFDLFEAMGEEYGNAQWLAYASQHEPIMNTGHHYAWTFPTLLKAPPDVM